jgi:hypothetical protein
MFWVALFGLIISTFFNILNYLQNKKIKKASIYIDKLLITPTPENIKEAREEAKYISSTTSSPLALTSRPIVNPQNEARVKALREETPNLDNFIKEQEKNREQK